MWWRRLEISTCTEMSTCQIVWVPPRTTVTVGYCPTLHHNGQAQRVHPFTIFQVYQLDLQLMRLQTSKWLEISTCQMPSQFRMSMWLILSMWLVHWLPMLPTQHSFSTHSQSRTSTHNTWTFLRILHLLETWLSRLQISQRWMSVTWLWILQSCMVQRHWTSTERQTWRMWLRRICTCQTQWQPQTSLRAKVSMSDQGRSVRTSYFFQTLQVVQMFL